MVGACLPTKVGYHQRVQCLGLKINKGTVIRLLKLVRTTCANQWASRTKIGPHSIYEPVGCLELLF